MYTLNVSTGSQVRLSQSRCSTGFIATGIRGSLTRSFNRLIELHLGIKRTVGALSEE